ncbi:glutathione-dependent reductase ['Osedax' symbiont bacterium Rs2_46_30_T18]|nr:glutathione-dependent reductase ['Osedax' symbiont bacterium Rs2_46_30_T18]
MGLIVAGKWVDQWYDTQGNQGQFVRQDSHFREVISASSNSTYPAEAGRYHLYVSLACPWAHRTLIYRKLKGLEDIISFSVVKPEMLENGWEFDRDSQDQYPDPLYQFNYAYQLYLKSNPDYQGRVTVPILWDKKTQTIVNNESVEIIRMFNSAFDHLTGNSQDYFPIDKRAPIEEINQRIYQHINNGVYRAGFATTQQAYESAYNQLFDTLEELESHLSSQRFLVGDNITEADWRLFTTLIRFDAIYHGHFKCNKAKLSEFHHLSNYLRELYQVPGVSDTVDLQHSKVHYYASHGSINPTAIVPMGPFADFSSSHDRARL